MTKKKNIIPPEEPIEEEPKPSKKARLWGWVKRQLPTFLAMYARYRWGVKR